MGTKRMGSVIGKLCLLLLTGVIFTASVSLYAQPVWGMDVVKPVMAMPNPPSAEYVAGAGKPISEASSEPEVSEPEVSEPEVSEPEVSEPEVSEPPVTESSEPVTENSEYINGETSLPEAGKPPLDPDKPVVALSFDDGPSKYTRSVVDTLLEYDSTATFFVVGSQLNKFSEETQYAFSSGMEIGNHTKNHKSLTSLDEAGMQIQVTDYNKRIEEVTESPVLLMRPPYGNLSDWVLENLGMPAIHWSVDPQDWKNRNAEYVAAHVLEHAKDGGIILLHDFYETTAEAVKIFLPKLVEAGYQVTSVSEMFTLRGESLEPGVRYKHLAG